MGRFILIFKGKGDKPAEDVERFRALRNTSVLDDSSRMILVEAPYAELKALVDNMPGWVISKEKMIPLPDLRPKINENKK